MNIIIKIINFTNQKNQTMSKIQIVREELIELLKQGSSIKYLALKYGVPQLSMSNLIKNDPELNSLRSRRRKVVIELVSNSTQPVQQITELPEEVVLEEQTTESQETNSFNLFN